MNIRISAIICTYNREQYLSKAIQSLVEQTLEKSNYEILVVDNASSDNTRLIVKGFESEKNLRYIFEPVLGLSHARNTGWKQAKGKYVAYLDDDAIASPQWLERIIEAFETQPRAGVVGGKVDPICEVQPPEWINEKLLRCLAIVDWSGSPRALADNEFLVGANIAFRKEILEKFSGFSTDLGRKGKNLISNEEIELVNKIKKNNQLVYYHPEIFVQHLVPSSRLKPKWFRNRFFAQGISEAILYCREEAPTKYQKRNYAWNLFKKIRNKPKFLIIVFFPSRFPESFVNRIGTIAILGFIYGLIKREGS